MKILYGVQGTGNGHISRARIMAKYFAARADVEVDFLFSGRAPSGYFDMDVFADYTTKRGVSFCVQDGEVDVFGTLKKAGIKQLWRDIRCLDLSQYDLVLNDFEPISAWAAKLQGVTSISISHQASFYYPIPKHGDTWADKMILKCFAPCNINMGVHWHHFGHSIMPPFIEESPVDTPRGGYYLVYLPFEDPGQIKAMLSPISEHQFVCYHPSISANHIEGNLSWCKPSKAAFKDSLQHCDGVIANAGFELSSESLKLGKSLLLKPLIGQFEQASNVLTLQHMGLCDELKCLDSDAIEAWLEGDLKSRESVFYPADPTPLIDWLLAGDWHSTAKICDALWQQVVFPEAVKARLENFG